MTISTVLLLYLYVRTVLVLFAVEIFEAFSMPACLRVGEIN